MEEHADSATLLGKVQAPSQLEAAKPAPKFCRFNVYDDEGRIVSSIVRPIIGDLEVPEYLARNREISRKVAIKKHC